MGVVGTEDLTCFFASFLFFFTVVYIQYIHIYMYIFKQLLQVLFLGEGSSCFFVVRSNLIYIYKSNSDV